MAMGMGYDETMTVPLSLLLDLISIEQIKREGARYRRPMTDADEWNELIRLR